MTSSSRNANGTLAESEELMSKNDRICAFVNENDSISFAEVKGTSGVAVAMA